jgi:hypothetical protein
MKKYLFLSSVMTFVAGSTAAFAASADSALAVAPAADIASPVSDDTGNAIVVTARKVKE